MTVFFQSPVGGIDYDSDPLLFQSAFPNPKIRAGYILKIAGHLAGAGTILTTGTLGTNVTSVTPLTGSDDVHGILTIVMAGALAINTAICTVTFAAAYVTNTPAILLSGMVDATRTVVPPGIFYADQTTTPLTKFVLKNTAALAAGTYGVGYHIIG